MAGKKIAISYAWKAKGGRKFKNAVELLCEELRNAECKVIRDVEQVKLGDDLPKFMRNIGRTGKICVFLSQAYLESANCMYELLIAFQRERDEPGKLARRLRVFLLPDVLAYGRKTAVERKQLRAFWKKEIRELQKVAKVEVADGAPQSTTATTIQRYKDIHSHLTWMLDFVFDHLAAKDFEAGMRDLRDEFGLLQPSLKSRKTTPVPTGPAITARSKKTPKSEPEFATVFASNLQAIKEILDGSPTITELLHKANSSLFSQSGFNLSAGTGQILDRKQVNSTFERLASVLKRRNLASNDKQSLFRLCGQLLVISVSPTWVSQQRIRGKDEPVQVPGSEFALPIRNDRGKSQFVNLMHLAAVAVAGVSAELSRLFAAPSADDRAIFDLPKVTPGITVAERRQEFQKFIIRKLLGPNLDLPSGNTPEAQSKIDQRFLEAVRLFQLEKRNGKPYYGPAEVQQRLEECLRHGELPTDCVVWLVGAGGNLRDIMPEYFDTFYYLREIYVALNARKA